jgi:cytochrome c5
MKTSIKKSVAIALVLIVVIGFATSGRPAASRGEEVYRSVCTMCHGIYGRGDGPALQYFVHRI